MKHLLVHAHPLPQSFCAAIRDRLHDTLTAKGHTVAVRNLYEEAYQPLLSAGDFEKFFRGELPEDVREEQEHVRQADVVHLIYPLWWTGMPAMLKGWVDRTFTPGFAYRRGSDGQTITPLLTGKKAVLWTPHGNTRQAYEDGEVYGALEKTMDSGIFRYVGMSDVEHFYFPDVRASSAPQRDAWLGQVEAFASAHAQTAEAIAR